MAPSLPYHSAATGYGAPGKQGQIILNHVQVLSGGRVGTSCSVIFGEPCPTKPRFSKFAEYFIHQHMNELRVQIALHLLSGVQEMRGACSAPRGPKLLMARTWKSNLLAEAENWTQTGCLSERWSLVTAATFSSSQHSRSKSSLLNELSPRFHP